MINRFIGITIVGSLLLLSACDKADKEAQRKTAEKNWIQLFDGESLKSWTPKFAGHKLGVNYNNTFRVEDSLLTVSYEEYEQFGDVYGHLFYNERPFSHYKIRAEYRFIGKQAQGGAGWALRNNGLMLHCQTPQSMALDQDYPVSIEVQLLGGDGTKERSTANLCTPGTNVEMNGELILQHCINSSSNTYNGDQWVTVEAEVRGSKIIQHIVEGDTVLSYTQPQYDDREKDAQKLIKRFNHMLIDSGYIAIQAESHPTQFRTIEVLPLDD